MTNNSDRLIVALDVATAEQAVALVDALADRVQHYKVGMESFYGMGHALLAQLAGRGKKTFIDLKLHDIPTTVTRSVKALCQFSPAMITLHAAGGPSMLRAARAAAEEWTAGAGRPRPRLLAITVLTSLNEREWVQIGYQSQIRESVLRMALMCQEAGLDGVVASPREAAAIRALCGPRFLIVTPGVRLDREENGDQTRTATPAEALKAGADYLVVGRPIVAAADPCEAAEAFLADMVP